MSFFPDNVLLTLIRHAQPLKCIDDKTCSLTDIGRLQAKGLGFSLKLRQMAFDLIITSTATRA